MKTRAEQIEAAARALVRSLKFIPGTNLGALGRADAALEAALALPPDEPRPESVEGMVGTYLELLEAYEEDADDICRTIVVLARARAERVVRAVREAVVLGWNRGVKNPSKTPPREVVEKIVQQALGAEPTNSDDSSRECDNPVAEAREAFTVAARDFGDREEAWHVSGRRPGPFREAVVGAARAFRGAYFAYRDAEAAQEGGE